MIVYNYSLQTKEYLGKFETNKILPNSTLTPVPSYQLNEIPVFNEIENKWEIVKDYRGKIVYSKINGTSCVIIEIGEIPESYTTIFCPDNELYSWNDEKGWVQNIELYKAKDRLMRYNTMLKYEWMFSRHLSEKRLVEAGKIENTTLTDEKLVELDIYFQEWRNYMENYYIGKEYPKLPLWMEE